MCYKCKFCLSVWDKKEILIFRNDFGKSCCIGRSVYSIKIEIGTIFAVV